MRNGLGPRTRKFGFDGYGHLDWYGQNLRPRTRKFGFYEKWIPDPKQDSMLKNLDLRPGQNTVSIVAPFLPFLRIENRAKIKRYIFCSKNLDFGEKTLKEWDNPV